MNSELKRQTHDERVMIVMASTIGAIAEALGLSGDDEPECIFDAIDELQGDAARYQQIRKGLSDHHGDVYAMVFAPDGDYPTSADDLDRTVDVAMARVAQPIG